MIQEVERFVTRDGKEHKTIEAAEAHIIDTIGAELDARFRNIKDCEYINSLDFVKLHKLYYAIALELCGDIDKAKRTLKIFDIVSEE